jgi:hypothetical protein
MLVPPKTDLSENWPNACRRARSGVNKGISHYYLVYGHFSSWYMAICRGQLPCSAAVLAVIHVPLEPASVDSGLCGTIGGTGNAIITGQSTPLLATLTFPALNVLYGRLAA